MSYEECNAWSALISGLITFAIFGSPIWAGTVGGTYETVDGLTLWAKDVLWLIGGGIGIGIAVVIGFQIVYALATRTEKPQFLTDERDIMISRRGSVVTLVIASAGFILGVVLMALGWTALAGLNAILGGMAAGAVISEAYRIAVYRFGL
ncbi:MAG: DUF2178 domain-containing protein [Yoonia sp.]|nr:DUF2178 domain-containing protein [Yoonia sp.]MDG1862814.1 DUF2178 domain-containing protein [Yoonia sp.]